MPKALAISFAVLIAGLLLAPALYAQGCAMCYTTAAGQDPAAARRLDMAILALLLPVLVLFAGVMTLAIKRRNSPEGNSQVPASHASDFRLNASTLRDADSSPHAPTVVRLHLELPPS